MAQPYSTSSTLIVEEAFLCAFFLDTIRNAS